MKYVTRQAIEQKRKDLKLTRTQLGKLAGVGDRSYLRKLEMGLVKRPAFQTIQSISAVLESYRPPKKRPKNEAHHPAPQDPAAAS